MLRRAGDGPRDARSAAFLLHYYGLERGSALVEGLLKSPDALRSMAQRYRDLGVGEMVVFPALPEFDQVDQLADAVLG